MNSKLVAFTFALGLGFNVQADYAFYFDAGSAAIPDNDPNGHLDSRTVGGMPGVISDVNVTLDISNGYNGDLYAWLSHGSGSAILLNRVGVSSANAVGYADPGFGMDAQQIQFTLDDQAAQDVHFYQAGFYTLNTSGQLIGAWQPDGRILDPESPAGLFDTALRSNPLGMFNGLDPNGEWILYLADVSSGHISTLTEWGLEITVVPEQSTFALAGLGAAALMIARRRR
ncbi:MAG TPA: PEP-CTERM sorting domain-containing protein [Candidatus Paceibacterota bacterium]|nr:PEP-CTERM sorting domain-containing protein [Verrucomicrobiota bacterium]HSA10029.1 PEP-CTERM sorting domain-containing protein [Candidatus Paceibacterota bacterium]